ncbi:unnamed protein product [Oppiella nova]|uniref:Uncharacterized protein n=1 Tax=Oppiella nova TaxID=334625 RepID=A0A7R9QCV2_9ACAR|nr:unnamed protein product [Oppiella nova]CAG2163363.1 unnamed protein product [Oppiella nova]
MGADVKLRHQSHAVLAKVVIILWHLMTINGYSTDLLSVPERIPIGALFDHKHQNLQTIFKQAIHQHNSNASLKFIVETAQEFVDHNDPTRVVRQLQCLHFNRGIYALLAPHFEAYAYKSALSFANTYRSRLLIKKYQMDSKGDSRRSSDNNNGKRLPVPSTTPDISTSSCVNSKAPAAETLELDDVIAALRAGDEEAANERESTPGSARQQPTRRKPMRWDDDEVEVDFSAQLGILAEDRMKSRHDNSEEVRDKGLDASATRRQFVEKPANDESFDGKHPEMNYSQPSAEDNNDDEDESGSDLGSEGKSWSDFESEDYLD